MKLFRKTLQQTTIVAPVAIFISTFFLCFTSQSISVDFARLDRFPTPKQINLSDPKVRASYTEEIQEKVMPLVSARTGQNYTLLSLEDYWNLVSKRQTKLKIEKNLLLYFCCCVCVQTTDTGKLWLKPVQCNADSQPFQSTTFHQCHHQDGVQ